MDGRQAGPEVPDRAAPGSPLPAGRLAAFQAGTIRRRLRSLALGIGHVWPARKGPFMRCLYLHNVLERERASFRTLLREIKNRGDVIATSGLIDILASGRQPSDTYFHLSFDDGFANVTGDAVAIMTEERVTATLFVATGFVRDDASAGVAGPVPSGTLHRPRRMASWNELRAAAASGFEIGSHSHTHVSLSAISGDPERLHREIIGSKHILEQQLGVPCTSFAWPRGRMADFDERSAKLVRQAGFKACFSAVRGSVVPGKTDHFHIPRHQIEAGWPLAHQRAFLTGQWEGWN